MLNPAVEQVLRCGGVQTGFFGWPDLPQIEAMRGAWIEAPDEDGRRKIAHDIQALAMQEVPYPPRPVSQPDCLSGRSPGRGQEPVRVLERAASVLEVY